jgi:diacylglycerol kinase
MNKKVKKRLDSFKYAFKGLAYVIKTQANMKIHLLATFLAVLTGLFLKISSIEWAILTLTICLVLVFESVNTAIEYFIDLVSPEYNEKAGHAKDIAAAAVLITAFAAIIIGTIIFLPKIIIIIKSI